MQEFAVHHASVYREWQEKYTDLVNEIFEKKKIKTFLDIGANTGAVIQFITDRHQLEKVYAFEPFETNFLLLREFIQRNLSGKFEFELHDKAIFYGVESAKACGTGDGNTGGMFLSNVRDEYVSISTVETGPIFKCSTLEKELSHVDHVDLAKIDVEGSEWNILENSSFLKDKTNDILLEFHWLDEEQSKSFIRKHMPDFEIVTILSNTMWLSRKA